jgi:hypothetical protein
MDVINRREYYHIESLTTGKYYAFYSPTFYDTPTDTPNYERMLFNATRVQISVRITPPHRK